MPSLLRVELRHEKPFEIELTKDSFAIGRSSDNDLNFNELSLSRHHAKILKKDERYYLEDAQSRNGTLLNGIRIYGTSPLHNEDVIQLGEITLRFIEPLRQSLALSDTSPVLTMAGAFVIDSDKLDQTQAEEDISGFSPTTLSGENLWLALSEAAAALIAHHPMEKLVEVIMDVVLHAVPAERGALIMIDPETPQDLRLKVVRSPQTDEKLQISRTIINEVIQNQKAILTQDAIDRFTSSESIPLQGIRSIMCVPLWNERDVIGLIYLDNLISHRAFTPSDLRLVAHIANMAAAKIENALLLQEQLKKAQIKEQLVVAAQIQRRLLPQFNPKIPAYEIFGTSHSCNEIGGDYYDFIEKENGKIAIVIADASGKGISAALLTAGFQASIRSLSIENKEPAALMTKLNRVMLENSDPNQYIRVFYAELDWLNHSFEYVNSGHMPPVLISKDCYTLLPGSGPAVGVDPNVQYDSKRISLEPKDLVFLYTNGITESRNPQEEAFGESRVVTFLMNNRNVAVEDLSELLEKNIRDFVQGMPPLDDSTMVLIKRLE